MSVYKLEDIAYVVESDGSITCADHLEYNDIENEDQIVTQDELENNEEIVFCDKGKHRIN